MTVANGDPPSEATMAAATISATASAASARRRGGGISVDVEVTNNSHRVGLSHPNQEKGLKRPVAAAAASAMSVVASSHHRSQSQKQRVKMSASVVYIGLGLCVVAWLVILASHANKMSKLHSNKKVHRLESQMLPLSSASGSTGVNTANMGRSSSSSLVKTSKLRSSPSKQRDVQPQENVAVGSSGSSNTGGSSSTITAKSASWVQDLLQWNGATAAATSSTMRTDQDDVNVINLQLSLQGKYGRLESCRWLSSSRRSDENNRRIQDLCTSATRPLVLYNPLQSVERLFHHSHDEKNNAKIPPLGTIVVDPKLQTEAATAAGAKAFPAGITLFTVVPQPDNAAQLPPVVLRYSGWNSAGTNGPLFDGCNVPCQSYGGPQLSGSRTVQVIDGTTWTFTYSMEGEQYYPELKLNPTAWRQNKFYSTTSYQSEVMLPYYSKAEYKIQNGHPPVNFDTAIHGAVFLARNCDSVNNREQRVKDLQASIIRTDSLSACLHNADPPPGADLSDKIDVMQRYLFYLAFENQCVEDYITEKLWGPMEAGTVPIYYGAPNVMEHVPNHSIIHVSDFKSTTDLVDYLVSVMNNKTLYESYHAWRKEPLPHHFQVKYNLTDTHSTCRMCRWAYARMYGVGWNHTMQELQPLKAGSRNVCLHTLSTAATAKSNEYLIRHPFNEMWSAPVDSSLKSSLNKEDSCRLDHVNRAILMDSGRLRRTVRYQDGVVDLLVEWLVVTAVNDDDNMDTTLQLHTPVASTNLTMMRDGVWRLQDAKVRYTLLSLPATRVDIRGVTDDQQQLVNGAIEIALHNLSWLRLRVIVEDIDTFHVGADTEENFFGKLMTADFFHPVEVFVQMDSAETTTSAGAAAA